MSMLAVGEDYLRQRWKIRQATEALPEPDGRWNEVHGRLDRVGLPIDIADTSAPLTPGRELGVDPAEVAVVFGQLLVRIGAEFDHFLQGGLGQLSATVETRPEYLFACILRDAIVAVHEQPGGLDARCDQLQRDAASLKALLHASGEVGSHDDRAPARDSGAAWGET